MALDEHRHFGRASKALGITQPTLSMMIKKLEEELQVILFDRDMAPLEPTEEGRIVIKRARTILLELKGLEGEIIEAKDPKDVIGIWKIAVIPTLANTLLPLIFSNYKKHYPKLKIEMQEMQTSAMVEKLKKGDLDVGILATPLRDSDLIETVLFYEKFFIFLNGIDKKEKYEASSLPHLVRDLDLLLLSEGHCFRHQSLELCHLKNTGKSSTDFTFAGGSFETLMEIIKNNKGITFIPELLVNQLSSSVKQKYVASFSNPIPTREISLVTTRYFLHQQKINILQKLILEQLPKEIASPKREKIKILSLPT